MHQSINLYISINENKNILVTFAPYLRREKQYIFLGNGHASLSCAPLKGDLHFCGLAIEMNKKLQYQLKGSIKFIL